MHAVHIEHDDADRIAPKLRSRVVNRNEKEISEGKCTWRATT